jgi:drug/metabolite transporter (DMT)-like permease
LPTGYGDSVERWRHALAIGFGIVGAIVAVLSGGDPAALSLALGGGLSTGLGYWVGALLNRRRDSR